MNMCHSFRKCAFLSIKLALISSLLVVAACASRPGAAPAAEPSPLAAQATGMAEQQASPPPSDDIVFVETERKEQAARDGTVPATSLHVETSGRKQHLGQMTAPE
jgi:hypothetical protein